MTAPRYTVTVYDGDTRVLHRDGSLGSRVVAHDCGHLHRTERAAEACLTRLLDSQCGVCGRKACRSHGGSRVWSARWHGATIARTGGES